MPNCIKNSANEELQGETSSMLGTDDDLGKTPFLFCSIRTELCDFLLDIRIGLRDSMNLMDVKAKVP